MAVDFNNQAVIENYSLREAMKALVRPEFNFLDEMQSSSDKQAGQNRKWIRNMAIDIVLATDMSKHFDLIKQFNVQIARNKKYKWMTTQEKWTAMSDAQIRLTLQMAMKARPFSSCPAACPVQRCPALWPLREDSLA